MSKAAQRIELGQRLKEAREDVYQSAVEASEATGIHVQSVRDQEAGRRGVDIDQLAIYARRYKVNLEWLATGRGPKRIDDNTIDFWARKLDKERYDEVLDFAKFKAESNKD